MRVGVTLVVGLGLLVITGSCAGPGATDDECLSQGNCCVDLDVHPSPACPEVFPQYSCSASGASFVCCLPPSGGECPGGD